jgi:hypothetical protein
MKTTRSAHRFGAGRSQRFKDIFTSRSVAYSNKIALLLGGDGDLIAVNQFVCSAEDTPHRTESFHFSARC